MELILVSIFCSLTYSVYCGCNWAFGYFNLFLNEKGFSYYEILVMDSSNFALELVSAFILSVLFMILLYAILSYLSVESLYINFLLLFLSTFLFISDNYVLLEWYFYFELFFLRSVMMLSLTFSNRSLVFYFNRLRTCSLRYLF